MPPNGGASFVKGGGTPFYETIDNGRHYGVISGFPITVAQ